MEQNHEIAKIAYELYLMRGGSPGDPVSDWITAERIYAERTTRVEKGFTVEERVDIAPAATSRARRVTVKTAPAEMTAAKETKKAATKTASVKAEKREAEPSKAKKVTRKKAPGVSAE